MDSVKRKSWRQRTDKGEWFLSVLPVSYTSVLTWYFQPLLSLSDTLQLRPLSQVINTFRSSQFRSLVSLTVPTLKSFQLFPSTTAVELDDPLSALPKEEKDHRRRDRGWKWRRLPRRQLSTRHQHLLPAFVRRVIPEIWRRRLAAISSKIITSRALIPRGRKGRRDWD